MFAFKNKHKYHDIDLNFTVNGNYKIAITVHDQRPEVVSKEKDPSYVGSMRSGVGIPYPIHTESGNPLASDITGTLAKGFSKRGFIVTPVISTIAESHEQVIGKLKTIGTDKLFVLHLATWNADSYQMVWLNFKLVLQVYDGTGKFLGQKMLEGTQDLGGSFWNPPKHAKKVIPPAFKQKMEELFNSPEIVNFMNQ